MRPPSTEPSLNRKLSALRKAVARYPKVRPDPRWFEDDGSFNGCVAEKLIPMVREDSVSISKPGFPFMLLGCQSVGQVLDVYPDVLCAAVNERLYARLREHAFEGLGGMLLAKRHLRDVVRLFVKNEPHSREKIDLGRFRLIMNSSLVDIVCDRVVGGALIKKEIQTWDTIPSKPGMGLDPVSVHKLRAGLPLGKKISSDVKAWDWCVREWLIMLAAAVETAQYGVGPSSDLAKLLRVSAHCTMNKILCTSDGELVEVEGGGIQESGSLFTASRNSKMRVLLAFLAGAEEAAAMGDDAVEVWLNGALDSAKYLEMGFRVEVPELPQGVEFEFCSTHFKEDGTYEPLNWAKTLFRLLKHKPDPALYCQFFSEMWRSSEWSRIRDYLRTTAWAAVMVAVSDQ